MNTKKGGYAPLFVVRARTAEAGGHRSARSLLLLVVSSPSLSSLSSFGLRETVMEVVASLCACSALAVVVVVVLDAVACRRRRRRGWRGRGNDGAVHGPVDACSNPWDFVAT